MNKLVTCITPTANRRAFMPRAIEYFLRQDYAPKELIIMDNGDGLAADPMPNDFAPHLD